MRESMRWYWTTIQLVHIAHYHMSLGGFSEHVCIQRPPLLKRQPHHSLVHPSQLERAWRAGCWRGKGKERYDTVLGPSVDNGSGRFAGSSTIIKEESLDVWRHSPIPPDRFRGKKKLVHELRHLGGKSQIMVELIHPLGIGARMEHFDSIDEIQRSIV